MPKGKEIVSRWLTEPSPEALMRARLCLLGWSGVEIERAIEEMRRETRQKEHQLPPQQHAA